MDPSFVRFKVVIQELSQEPSDALAHGKGGLCLDLTTRDSVSASGCPDAETGEGRPALGQGKRFVRIPSVEEGDAAENARRWVADLRPDFGVILVDECGAVPRYVWDPAAGTRVGCPDPDEG
jgi:hypothetical protein